MVNYLQLRKRYLDSRSHQKKKEEWEYFRNMPNINGAAGCAILSVDKNGKRFIHQNHLLESVRYGVYNNINNIIADCKRGTIFEDFLDTIQNNMVKGYGRLARVDFAFRMAAYTGILPEVICVQAGSYRGAKLLGLKINKDKYNGHYVKKSDIPEELRDLDTIILENFLCWYSHNNGGQTPGKI
jgi:hypothetical protein